MAMSGSAARLTEAPTGPDGRELVVNATGPLAGRASETGLPNDRGRAENGPRGRPSYHRIGCASRGRRLSRSDRRVSALVARVNVYRVNFLIVLGILSFR